MQNSVFSVLLFIFQVFPGLLTWIINLVKWNAGVVKYKFQHNPVPQQQEEALQQI